MLLENINKEKICDDFIYPKENNDDTNKISRIGLGGYVLPIDDHDLSVEIVNENNNIIREGAFVNKSNENVNMKWMSVVSSNDSQYEKIQEWRCDILTRMKKYEEELNKLSNLNNYLSRFNGNCIRVHSSKPAEQLESGNVKPLLIKKFSGANG